MITIFGQKLMPGHHQNFIHEIRSLADQFGRRRPPSKTLDQLGLVRPDAVTENLMEISGGIPPLLNPVS
jgi:hypothetical protein